VTFSAEQKLFQGRQDMSAFAIGFCVMAHQKWSVLLLFNVN